MKQLGRLGGLKTAGTRDPKEYTRAGRSAFLGRFLAEVDAAEPGLPEAERSRRADALLRLYMARLALQSSRVRAARARIWGHRE